MTREEAVEVLKERYLTCVGIGLDNHANRVNEAIDMAIEALHREEAEEKGYCHRILPSNVEVVVRCKDCIYYETCNLRSSHWWKGGYAVDIEFCSFGERREK